MNKLYTLHSGGAYGSDYEWGKQAEKLGITIKHYFYKYKTPYGNTPINNTEYKEGIIEYQDAAKRLNKNISRKPYILALMSRNWHIIKQSEIILSIGNLDVLSGIVHGGTGYGIIMAQKYKKMIYIFNQINNKWYTYNYTLQVYQKSLCPIICSNNFAGIGTRNISKYGKNAIREVFDLFINNK